MLRKNIVLIPISLIAGSLFCSCTYAISPGFFITGGIGQVNNPTELSINHSKFSRINASDTLNYRYGFEKAPKPGLKIGGGYNFNHNFGLLLDFQYWGEQDMEGVDGVEVTHHTDGNLNSNTFGLMAVGYMPFYNEKFNFFATGGFDYNYTKVSIIDDDKNYFHIAGDHAVTQREFSFAYGLGAQYNFTQKVGANVTWDQRLPDLGAGLHQLYYSMLSANIVYNFV